jgi:predicted RecA/RadA family phage recombinase
MKKNYNQPQTEIVCIAPSTVILSGSMVIDENPGNEIWGS